MNPDTIKAIQDALTPLAQKIGQGAGQLFEVYTRQVLAEGWTGIALSVFFIVLSVTIPIVLGIFAWRELREHQRIVEANKGKSSFDREAVGDPVFATIFVGSLILGLCVIVMAIFSLRDNALMVANPQYYAIDRILTTVRGL